MSDSRDITIKLEKSACNSSVLIDGEEMPGVHKVKIDAEVGKVTAAVIYVYPDKVEADLDASNLSVIEKVEGDE